MVLSLLLIRALPLGCEDIRNESPAADNNDDVEVEVMFEEERGRSPLACAAAAAAATAASAFAAAASIPPDALECI